ncbi:MAG TPA: hypothetical protein VL242_49570 [Sorangium sp.]|nr:hypothetical protein [Sorangium sp.]
MTAMLATRAGWELEEADNVTRGHARACAMGAHVRPPVLHASPRRHRLAPSASIAPAVEALFANERTGDAPHVSIPRPEIELMFRFGPAAPRGLDAHAFGARQRVRRFPYLVVYRDEPARIRAAASRLQRGA